MGYGGTAEEYQPNYTTCPHCNTRLCDGEAWSHSFSTCKKEREELEAERVKNYSSGDGCCVIL